MAEKIGQPIGLTVKAAHSQEFYDSVKRKFAKERGSWVANVIAGFKHVRNPTDATLCANEGQLRETLKHAAEQEIGKNLMISMSRRGSSIAISIKQAKISGGLALNRASVVYEAQGRRFNVQPS